MKKFKLFCKTTLALATMLLLGGSNVWGAWSWTGETRSAGQFYFMNKQYSQFMSVNESGAPYLVDIENAFVFSIGASGKTDLAYTVGGTTYYVYQDAGTYGYCVDKQDAPGNGRCTSSFANMDNGGWELADWNNSDNNFRFKSNHKYNQFITWGHRSDENRYIYVPEASGTANCTKNNNEYNTDKARWFLISEAQKSVYDKRTISFSATATAKGEGTATASVENQTVELSDYADRNESHSTKATFTATPNDGKVFVGWSTDEEVSNIISHNKEYQTTISNNWNEGQTSSLTLYAIFGDKFEPSITAEKYDLKVEEQTALTFTHTENLAAPVIGNTSVISYADGVVTALAEGTSTLTFTQAETNEIKAKVIVLTFNVSKHDVVWSWNAENVAYIYNTTINNIFTLTEGNPSNISIVSDNEYVAKVENGNLVIGKVAGTAQFTVTAVADNKWNAKEETFFVTPGHVANHVPFTIDSEEKYNTFFYARSTNNDIWTVGTGVDAWRTGIRLGRDDLSNWNDKFVDIHFEGTPDKMSFQTSLTGSATGVDYRIFESEDGVNWGSEIQKWTDKDLDVKDLQLKPTTRYVRLFYTGNYCAYFKNVTITELKTLSAETPEAIMTKLGDTESVSTNIVLTYANAGLTINASVSGEGFSIDKTSVEGGIDVYGEETFVVSFDPTGKAAGEYTATVRFTDGTLQKEVVVTAHVLVPLALVAHNNDGNWATFSSTYNVEFGDDVTVYTVTVSDESMELHEVDDRKVPANTGVLIKSDKTEISYVIVAPVAALENNMLKPGENGLTAGENCRFYRLAYYDYTNETGLGFYYGPNCNDGEAFMCKAGLAYLAVPRTPAAPARFLLDRQDISTDLLNVNVNDNQGKKVMMNGVLYIVRDGKTYDSFGRMVK